MDMKQKMRARMKILVQAEYERTKGQAVAIADALDSFFLGEHCSRKFPDVLAAYISFGMEISTREIISRFYQRGCRIYVPQIRGLKMEMLEIPAWPPDDSSGIWEKNRFGIYELKSGMESSKLATIMESGKNRIPVLVPGLAFSRTGQRLGRGGGFYDRFLQENQDALETIGLAYPCQVMDDIPTENHDMSLDYCLTVTEFLHFNGVFQKKDSI